jgi:phosphate-selective porin OprO and OprP
LSCGIVSQPVAWSVGGTTLNTSTGSGNCTKNVETLNAELFASYGSLSLQGEYYASWYNRDASALQRAQAAQPGYFASNGTINPVPYFVPGGTSLFFSGGYAQVQYWLTGEEKVSAYKTDDKAGAVFGQVKVKHPFGENGWGAWGIAARFSAVDLNSGGPYQGANRYGALYWAQNTPLTGTAAQQNATRVALQNQITNAGISGGLQQNVTVGLNWLPKDGVQIQANWTYVARLQAPFNLVPTMAYYSGAHSNLVQLMGKVYW